MTLIHTANVESIVALITGLLDEERRVSLGFTEENDVQKWHPMLGHCDIQSIDELRREIFRPDIDKKQRFHYTTIPDNGDKKQMSQNMNLDENGETLNVNITNPTQRLSPSDLSPPSKMNQRGRFILFEGGDRCGKTTQVKKFVERLKLTEDVIDLHFPIRTTPSGRIINDYLQKKIQLTPLESHWLFALNRWETCRFILDTLGSGTTIICDRYVYSGMAYSIGCLNMTAENISPMELCLPKPDIVLELSVDILVSSTREGFGDEVYEDTQMQARVHKVFEKYRNLEFWNVIQGNGTIDEVHKRIWDKYTDMYNGTTIEPTYTIDALMMTEVYVHL